MIREFRIADLPPEINNRPTSEWVSFFDEIDLTEPEMAYPFAIFLKDKSLRPKKPPLHPEHIVTAYQEGHEGSDYLDTFDVQCTVTAYRDSLPAVTLSGFRRYLQDRRHKHVNALPVISGVRAAAAAPGLASMIDQTDTAIMFNKPEIQAVPLSHFLRTVEQWEMDGYASAPSVGRVALEKTVEFSTTIRHLAP